MKTLNVIYTELKKLIISPYFLVGVLAFTLMCFSSPGYFDGEKEYSIFEMITMLDSDKVELYDFSAQSVCSRGFGGWLMMFLSIIVSFPFVKLLCDERRCSEKRYLISRTGVFRYCLSKFVSAVVSAALICAVGFLTFSGIVHIIFPQAQPDMLMYSSPYWKYLLQTVLTGICVSILPFLICSVTTNQYFCICIPFLIQYMYNTASNKFMMETGYDNSDTKSIIVQSITPINLGSLVYGIKTSYYTLIIYAVFAVAALFIFSFAQRRCTDIGQ